MPKKLRLTGTVSSGSGEGAKFVKLSWVKNQIAEKLGFKPYPGTLNIKLHEDSIKTKRIVMKAKPIEIIPTASFCRGKCYRAFLKSNVKCAVVIPQVPDYPEDVLEIVAPVNLRKKFELRDGDKIEVEILIE